MDAATSASDVLDRELAAAALEKRRAGERPTRQEQAALRRVEQAREEELRRTYYRTIPQKHWVEMSGRQPKVLREQGARYGLPFGGKTIDLPLVVRSLHDFLAKNKLRLTASDDDPLLSGAPSAALERYRSARAKLAERDLAEKDGELLNRDQVYRGFSAAAAILRRAGENLQRRYGAEAQELLNEALDEFERKVIETLQSESG